MAARKTRPAPFSVFSSPIPLTFFATTCAAYMAFTPIVFPLLYRLILPLSTEIKRLHVISLCLDVVLDQSLIPVSKAPFAHSFQNKADVAIGIEESWLMAMGWVEKDRWDGHRGWFHLARSNDKRKDRFDYNAAMLPNFHLSDRRDRYIQANTHRDTTVEQQLAPYTYTFAGVEKACQRRKPFAWLKALVLPPLRGFCFHQPLYENPLMSGNNHGFEASDHENG